ncbi:MAG TPA: hypothetical protein H9683_00650 [Firmicutes bacterium]|nr:hypothetical protein [Bacillota bacterium]
MEAFTEEKLAQRQRELDVDKWLASEAAGYDLCGSFTFCARCERWESHPCARAEARWLEEQDREIAEFEAAQAEMEENPDLQPVPEEAGQTEDEPEEEADEAEVAAADAAEPAEAPAGYEYVTRYRRSFKSRLIQDEKMQDFYTDLKNAFSELTGVKTRLSRHCENFRYHADRIAKLNVGGKTLTLYLALDPSAYEDTKYRYEDVSDRKTYTETPMKIRITSKRMVKYAKELLQDLAAKYSVTVSGCIPMDYHMKYQTDEALIKKGLIKPYQVLVKKKKK